MKKQNNVSTFKALLACLISAICLVGCTNNPLNKTTTAVKQTEAGSSARVTTKSEEKTSSKSSTTVEVKEPTLELSKTSLTLGLFETAELTAKATNISGDVVWTVVDETVLSFTNGKIVPKKIGTTKITAQIGELKEECSVTVNLGTLLPEFDSELDEVTLFKGFTYQIDGALTLSGKDFTDAVVSFETTGNAITISESGLITAAEYGTQKVTVKATAKGELVASYEVTVTVTEIGLIETGIAQNTLSLNATTYNESSVKEFNLSGLVAKVNGEVYQAEFTYLSSNEEVVIVEEEKIKALKAGEATVKVSFSTQVGTYDTTITVSVVKETVELSESFKVKSNGGDAVESGLASIDLSEKDIKIDLSTLTKVLVGETEIAFEVEESTLKLTNAPKGESTYKLVTPDLDVILNGFVYQIEISNKAELLDRLNNAGGKFAYCILTSDIDLENTTLVGNDSWTRQVIDGQGHTISNFVTYNGLIANSNELGTFKNLQIVNVTLDLKNENLDAKAGILGGEYCGSYENILLIANIINVPENQDLIVSCLFEASSYKNMILVLNNESSAGATLFGQRYKQGNGATFENVYAVVNGEVGIGNADANQVKVYASVQDLLANADFSNMNGWTVEAGKLPYLSEYESKLVTSYNKVVGDVLPGSTVQILSTLPGYKLTCEDESLVINGTYVTIPATGGKFTVNISSIYSTQLTSSVELFGYNSEEITTTQNYAVINDGNATIDLSKLSVSLTNISNVSVNGINAQYEVNEGVLTFATTEGTSSALITLISGTTAYKFNIIVADYAISDVSSFDTWLANYQNYKYTVLTADVNYNGTAAQHWDTEFKNVLDGQGHKIVGLTLGCGLFANGGMSESAVVKNITFEGFNKSSYGFIGGYTQGGTLDNVYVSMNITLDPTTEWNAVVAHFTSGKLVVKNCTFDVRVKDEFINKTLKITDDANYYYAEFVNNTFICNCALYTPGVEYETGKAYLNEGHTTWTDNTVTLFVAQNITTTQEMAVVNNGNIVVDLTKLSTTVENIKSVKLNGVSADFSVEGTNLTVACTTGRDVTIVLETAVNAYTFTLLVADFTISDVDTFNTWLANYQNYKYTILTADVNYNGTASTHWSTYFNNVLDGQGHKIVGLTLGYGLFADKGMEADGVIKNITFEGLTVNEYGFLGAYSKGTLEDVNVYMNYGGTVGAGWNALLVHEAVSKDPTILRVKNCNFDVRVKEEDINKTFIILLDENYYDTYFENCSFICNCALYTPGVEYETGKAYLNEGHCTWKNNTVKLFVAEELTTSQQYTTVESNQITLDLSKLSKSVTGYTKVQVDGSDVTYTVSENNLVIDYTNYGVHTITFFGELYNYTVKIVVVDYVITDKDSFKTWHANYQNYKYAILTNDVIINETIDTHWGTEFENVLDGQGHKVVGLGLAYGLFATGGMDVNAVVKNITFEGLTNNEYGLLGGYIDGGTLENVNVYMNYTGTVGAGWNSILCVMASNTDGNALKIKNCLFDIRVKDEDISKKFYIVEDAAYYYNSFENTTFICNCPIYGLDEVGPSDKHYLTSGKCNWVNCEIKLFVAEELTTSQQYTTVESNQITLDLSKLSKSVTGYTKVRVDGTDVTYTVSENNLVIDYTNYGVHTITFFGELYNYTVKIVVADYVITDKDSFKAWLSAPNSYSYAVLANDVTINEKCATIENTRYSKIFDGLGHKVIGLEVGYGLFHSQGFDTTGALKNVVFENLTIDQYGFIGGYSNGGLIENVQATINYKGTVGAGYNKVLCQEPTTKGANALTVRNCVFDIRVKDEDLDKTFALFRDENYYDSVIENTTFICNCAIYGVDEGTDGSNHFVNSGHCTWTNSTIVLFESQTITTTQEYALISGGNIVVDLTKLSETIENIQSVKVGSANSTFSVSGTNLTASCDKVGSVSVEITSNTCIFTFTLLVADYAITNESEYLYWFANLANYNYVVLANDVTLTTTDSITTGGSYVGTFDGLNHTVSNLKLQHGLLGSAVMKPGSCVKNVTFNNVEYVRYGLFGGYPEGGIVDNVVVNAHFNATVDNNEYKSVICHEPTAPAGQFVIKNSTFNIKVNDTEIDKQLKICLNESYWPETIENCTFNTNGTILGVDEIYTETGAALLTSPKCTWTNSTINNKVELDF